eukprot:1468559-Lingulodinium_polyedra.AAC.1
MFKRVRDANASFEFRQAGGFARRGVCSRRAVQRGAGRCSATSRCGAQRCAGRRCSNRDSSAAL